MSSSLAVPVGLLSAAALLLGGPGPQSAGALTKGPGGSPPAPPPVQQLPLFQQLVEHESAPQALMRSDAVRSLSRPVRTGSDLLRAPEPRAEASTLDCQHARHDITLDPATGATRAVLELRVRARERPLSSVGFVIDDGLTVGDVTAGDRSTAVTESVDASARGVRVDLVPPLAPGRETVITVPYSGTLSCGPSRGAGVAACSKGQDFSYFIYPSIFPFIFDPDAPSSLALDGLTREIVLRVPAGMDVVVTGERISEVTLSDTKVSTWSIGEPLSRVLAIYAFVGKLGQKPVLGRSVPTMLVFPPPETASDEKLAAWSSPALDFIEDVTGTKLPFQRSLSLVRLPQALRDPGTATFGMTLLSDAYAGAGDLIYEETWTHENAHLFWGIVVPETDPGESRLMTEGMATLLELDYTFTRYFASEDRDEYLARRLLPMTLDMRSAKVPPVRIGPNERLPEPRTQAYTAWAYYETAATLDHLRVTVGEDVFANALREYVARCRFVGCRPDALREVLEEQTGTDLQPFFDRWVSGNERPEVSLGFTPTGAAGGADVELTKPDDRPMTLELWLFLEDRRIVKERVVAQARVSRVHIDTGARVLRVAANPRHALLVDLRSAVPGDLDFDGETDGFDILRCARQIGRVYRPERNGGLWNLAETFDPRCDVNGDGSIDGEDLARLSATFGILRPATQPPNAGRAQP